MKPWKPKETLISKISSGSCFCAILAAGIFFISCTAIYGWNIHAPGILSEEFAHDIPQASKRVAIYIPEGQKDYFSTDKGTRFSDPQKYFVGEAFVPMLIESFQSGFSEFILMEAVPTPDIMRQYAIDALVVSEIKDFKNRKSLPAQGLDLYTETTVFNRDLKLIRRFETRGTSEARGTFAKKGGLEVNLNAYPKSTCNSVRCLLASKTRASYDLQEDEI